MSRISSRMKTLLAALVAAGTSTAALAQSVPYPTYQVGPQPGGSFVVSDGAIITPAGKQVNLGIRVRAKAVAVNPTGNHTAAVLTMGTRVANGNGAVEVFNTQTGAVLQSYSFAGKDSHGSHAGISYTPDGKFLLFSQDSSYVAIASVKPDGTLADYAHVQVPIDATIVNVPVFGNVDRLTTVTCFPNSPPGTDGSNPIPCGIPLTQGSSYPMGLAVTKDSKTAYVVLDANNTLAKIDLTKSTPVELSDVRVGNVPHSVVISPDGKTAYVSNEAGRIATQKDFQEFSNGTPVVARYPEGSTAGGTVSIVDLASFKVTGTIPTGLHPTGMAFDGKKLLVANTYGDSISVIDTAENEVERTIHVGPPVSLPGSERSAFGSGPNSIAVDPNKHIAYVALYNANAIAVVDLQEDDDEAVLGMIPVGYAPSSVTLDTSDNVLIVANDKGVGTTDTPPHNSSETDYGVSSHNTHQDLGTVSIVPLPSRGALDAFTRQVFENNHWDLKQNIASASGGSPSAAPRAIPKKIGDPSKIKHVFLIIRENRTYDQVLGDVAGGNGDPSLAVFGASVTPNAHAIVQRFPLLDNFYDPSRQSADGHNWIVQAIAPYSDDIQSPDWARDYPSNGGDAIAYQPKGNLYDLAVKSGIRIKNFGEYIEWNAFKTPAGSTTEPSWTDFYNDTLEYESGAQKQLYYFNTISSFSPLPDVMNTTIQNYPQFDLGIPDQFRVDVWQQDFWKDVKAGTVPQLTILWISSDHTGGPPTAKAMQADNDLAFGRFVDIISHSPVWNESAIFVEEDDAQNGVDHVDGHRSPAYIISPYVRQGGVVDSHYYSQVNLTRTVEQILGLKPMNQNDLIASPMRTLFIDNPPAQNFKPWTHVPNLIPLDQGVPAETHVARNSNPVSPEVKALQAGWLKKKKEIFADKYHVPDSEDPDTVNHLTWYEATDFARPYPGEKKVRPASDFKRPAPARSADLDD